MSFALFHSYMTNILYSLSSCRSLLILIPNSSYILHGVSNVLITLKGGQNLAKLDICGAKCVILDVSGKFQDLWERYYADADAVIFCWRLDHPPQHALLEKVRHEISDDVPFLIFGHEFDLTTATKTQSSTTPLPQHESNFTSTFSSPTTLPTEWFLPHYHSNLMMAFCGSAHNGAGVRDAMEWLIPLAKRQAKLRVTIPIPQDM
jgi:ADP-ribosylation factor family